MKLEDIEEITKVLNEIKKLELIGWRIDNISLQYFESGQINLRLFKKKETFEDISMEDENE